jgi:hypothetical protein
MGAPPSPNRPSASDVLMAAVVAGAQSIARRRFPAIDALPRGPQLADHVAFGALVGATLP